MNLELLKRLASDDLLVRRLVQPVQNAGVVSLGGTGYVVSFSEYGELETFVAQGLASFRKVEIAGADFCVEELYVCIEPKGLLLLQSELARQEVLA